MSLFHETEPQQPQKQWCRRRVVKNPGKISENLGEILKYLGKIPEYLDKNGAQRCFTSKMVTTFAEKQTQTFFL